jgi:UDP-glucuronate 4-epimerase
MNNQHILITGVAGFIASHLAETMLSRGYRITGIDNFDDFYSRELKESNLTAIAATGGDRFRFYELDLTHPGSLNKVEGEIDAVIHIAAKAGVRPSIQHPQAYIQHNINGTQHILDWMLTRGCKKLLFASSSSVYGNNTKVPFSESDAVDHPVSPYAFTKKTNELQIHTYHHLYGIDAVCMRFFTVYGPRQRPDLAIRKFIQLIDSNQPIEMYGDGSTARDYTYVSDTVAGIAAALDYVSARSGVYEIVNLGNSSPIALKDMINTISQLMGKEPDIQQKPMQPGDVEITYADISKAKQLLGYQPKVTFREGVKNLIDWLKNKNA